MNEHPAILETLFNKARECGKTSIELFRLKGIRKIADVLSFIITHIFISITMALAIFMASIGLALYIGAECGNSYMGFMIVALGYLLLAVLMFIFRNTLIKHPLQNTLISQMKEQ